MSRTNLRFPAIALALIVSGTAIAAKGPSPAEIKKHSSKTLKVSSKANEAQCKAACDDLKSCNKIKYDKRTKRCELFNVQKRSEKPVRQQKNKENRKKDTQD